MILRILRTWWARVRLIGLLRNVGSSCYYANTLQFPECASGGAVERSCHEPYQALAEFWPSYAELFYWDYCSFLLTLSKARQVQLLSVLDLACGTGTQLKRIASFIPNAVGLDVSEAMLVQARTHCSNLPSSQFVHQDFRNFHLGQEFDAIVCACNSINYVNSLDELTQLFHSVAQHLRPNGLFVFDTFTQVGMQLISEQYLHVQVSEKRFAILFEFDQERKIEKATIQMPSGVEIHHRIPIDSQDVKTACQGTGLVVDSEFSTFLMPGWMYYGPVRFFVLTKAPHAD